MNKNHLHVTCAIIEQEGRVLAAQRGVGILEITPPHYAGSGMPRPRTSMVESSLFTGSPEEPQLVQELLEEMRSADAVDILVFARPMKKHNHCTVPFVFLGPARQVSHQKERPIQMVWELRYPMPVEMFEENRRGG